jgi:translation initiation factor 2B subunit (eIF-2B alpha/beta/delta family)
MAKMNPKVVQKIDQLKNDRIHGAGWTSREAISILGLAINESEARNTSEMLKEIKTIAAEISRAKPNMVSISNYVHQILNNVTIAAESTKNIHTLKTIASAATREIIKLSEDASNLASAYGGRIISNLDTVITCSYSATVCMALQLAWEEKTKFHVLVAESRSNDDTFGRLTAKQLKEHQIPVEIIKDESITKRISSANKAIVGADSILSDGSLINGTPTLALAMAARDAKIPFFAICETAKFDTKDYIDKTKAPEIGLDKVPPDLITGIVMEKGVMQTNVIVAYIEESARTT